MYVCTWWGLNWQKDSSKSQLFTFYVVLCIKSYWNANFSIKIHFITPWKYAFDVIKMTPHFLLHQLLSRSREVPLGIYFSNYKKIPREIHISNICGSCLDICKSLLILFMVVINVFSSVTKNPHCAGARTVPALYGCGPHSNLGFHGH